MAGDDSTATVQAIRSLVHEVSRLSVSGFNGVFKKDCIELSRRVALLSHLFEEIRDSQGDRQRLRTPSFRRSICQLTVALQAAMRLLQSAGIIPPVTERVAVEFTCQFRGVRFKLEKALANFPYDDFELSKEVKKQIDMVRRRYRIRTINAHQHHHGVESKVPLKPDMDPVIPDDFLCPISLELFTDPVFVSTGQTYERSYIQQWIDHGNTTCPKTGQTLNNLTLTPNYALRSLIDQWCPYRNVEQPRRIAHIQSQTIEEHIQSQTIEEEIPSEFMIVLMFIALCFFTSTMIIILYLKFIF